MAAFTTHGCAFISRNASTYSTDNRRVVFTQIRPGEKLFEEILTNSEIPTKHEKIFMAKLSDFDDQKLIQGLEKFKQALDKMDKNSIIKILKEKFPDRWWKID